VEHSQGKHTEYNTLDYTALDDLADNPAVQYAVREKPSDIITLSFTTQFESLTL